MPQILSLCIFIGPMNQTESDSVNVSIDSNSFRLDKSWIFLSIAYRRDPGIRVDEGSSESGTTAGSSAVAKKRRRSWKLWILGGKVWLLWKFMKENINVHKQLKLKSESPAFKLAIGGGL